MEDLDLEIGDLLRSLRSKYSKKRNYKFLKKVAVFLFNTSLSLILGLLQLDVKLADFLDRDD